MKKVKVILVKNNKQTFEKEIEKYINENYILKNSTIIPMTMNEKISLNLIEQKYMYYAILIKE